MRVSLLWGVATMALLLSPVTSATTVESRKRKTRRGAPPREEVDAAHEVVSTVDKALSDEAYDDAVRWSAETLEEARGAEGGSKGKGKGGGRLADPRAEADRLRRLLDEEETEARAALDRIRRDLGAGALSVEDHAALKERAKVVEAEMRRIDTDKIRLDRIYEDIEKVEARGGSGAVREERELREFAGDVANERKEYGEEIRREEGSPAGNGGAPSSKAPSEAEAHEAAEARGRKAADANLHEMAVIDAELKKHEREYRDMARRLAAYKKELTQVEHELSQEIVSLGEEKRDLSKVLEESRRIAGAIRENAKAHDKEHRELNSLRTAVLVEVALGALVLAGIILVGFFRTCCGSRSGGNSDKGYTSLANQDLTAGMQLMDINDEDL